MTLGAASILSVCFEAKVFRTDAVAGTVNLETPDSTSTSTPPNHTGSYELLTTYSYPDSQFT